MVVALFWPVPLYCAYICVFLKTLNLKHIGHNHGAGATTTTDRRINNNNEDSCFVHDTYYYGNDASRHPIRDVLGPGECQSLCQQTYRCLVSLLEKNVVRESAAAIALS